MIVTYTYHNQNPNPSHICPTCQADIGQVYLDGQDRPTLPRHHGCYCYYQRQVTRTKDEPALTLLTSPRGALPPITRSTAAQ